MANRRPRLSALIGRSWGTAALLSRVSARV